MENFICHLRKLTEITFASFDYFKHHLTLQTASPLELVNSKNLTHI